MARTHGAVGTTINSTDVAKAIQFLKQKARSGDVAANGWIAYLNEVRRDVDTSKPSK